MQSEKRHPIRLLLSWIMSISLIITSLNLSGLVTERTEAAPATATTASERAELRKKIVKAALERVGKGYSDTSRNGPNTYDCSGLVRACLVEAGFDQATIPSTTLAWRNAFNAVINNGATTIQWNNGTEVKTLSYNGKPFVIGVMRATDTQEPKNVDAYFHVYSSKEAYLADLSSRGDDLIAGDLFFEYTNANYTGDGHAAILLGKSTHTSKRSGTPAYATQIRDMLNTAAAGAMYNAFNNHWTGLNNITGDNYALIALLNALNARDGLINKLYNELLPQVAASQRPMVALDNNVYSIMTSIGAANSAQTLASWNVVGFLDATTDSLPNLTGGRGGIVDYTAAGDPKTASDIWRVEALSTKRGVAITNNTGGKSNNGGSFIALELPRTYFGEVNIQKVGTTNQAKGGARFGVYSTEAAAISGTHQAGDITANGVVMTPNDTTGLHHYEINWNQADAETMTVYIKEIATPPYYDYERNAAGNRVIHVVTFNGEAETVSVKDTYITDAGTVVSRNNANNTLNSNTLTFTAKDSSALRLNIEFTKTDNDGNPVTGAASFEYGTAYSFDTNNNAVLTNAKAMTRNGSVYTASSDVWEYNGTSLENHTLYFREKSAPSGYEIKRGTDGRQYVYRVVGNGFDPATYSVLINGTWQTLTAREVPNDQYINYSFSFTKKDNGNNNLSNASVVFQIGSGYSFNSSNNVVLTGPVNITRNGATYSYTAAQWLYKGNNPTKTLYFAETAWPNDYVPRRGSDGKQAVYRVIGNGLTKEYEIAELINGTWTTIANKTVVDVAKVTHTVKKQFGSDSKDTAKSTVTSVSVQLQRKVGSGAASNVGSEVTLNSGNNWTYTWNNLDKFDGSGNAYTYSTVETKINGTAVASMPEYKSVASTSGSTTTITNYRPNVTTSIPVTKLLEGRNFNANDSYTFKITSTTAGDPNRNATGWSSNAYTLTLSGSNASSGKITGSIPLSYTLSSLGGANSKAFTYTIVETGTSKDGTTIDSKTYNVTATVTLSSSNTLSVSLTDAAGAFAGATFTNRYRATGTLSVAAKKQLSGMNLVAGQFTFNLTTNDGFIANKTVTNDVNGNVDFGSFAISTDTKGIVGDHEIYIKEVNDGVNWIGYDTKTVTIYVRITDDQKGHLTASLYSNAGRTATYQPATFTNSYKTTSFQVKKEFANADIQSKITEVEVELLRDGAATGKTAKLNAANSWTYTWQNLDLYDTASADPTKAHQYTYTARETKVNNVALASTSYEAVTTASSATSQTIRNYEPKTGKNLTIEKILENRAFTDGDSFTVTVTPKTAGDPNNAKTVVLSYADVASGKLTKTTGFAYTYSDLGRPTANKSQTYTYEVKETANSKSQKGVTSDTKTYTVDIVVSYDAAAHSMKATASPTDKVTITNTYHASGSFSVDAKKIYENQSLSGGEFTFELASADGLFATKTAKNDKDGKVDFGSFNVTESAIGDHKATIKEQKGTLTFVNYDSKVVNLIIRVTDPNKDGKLVCQVLDENGKAYQAAAYAFTNVYTATGTTTIQARKQFKNQSLKGGEFTFELVSKDSLFKTITATNDKDGKVSFPAINFDQSAIGTHKAVIREVKGAATFIDYDSHEVEITIIIADNHDGTLKVTVNNADGLQFVPTDATFINTYHATGTFNVNAYKEYVNQSLNGGEFNFELTSEDGLFTTLKASNDATGKVAFANVNVTEADLGTHVMTIREVSGSATFIDYDSTQVTVKVEITDNHDGTLTCKLTDAADLEWVPTDHAFINTYHATGDFTVKAFKEFKNQQLKGGEFDFSMTFGADTYTASNDKNGNVTFTTIAVDEQILAGNESVKIPITIKETSGSATFIDYDSHEVTLYVTIKDNHDGTLTCSLSNDQDLEYVPNKDGRFTNTYHATGTFSISGQKVYKNQAFKGGEFTFKLSSADGRFADQTVTNDANGDFAFAAIDVTEASIGTHEVTVEEVAGNLTFVEYDSHKVTLSVVITDNHDGTLTAEVLNDKGLAYSVADTTFTNTYRAKGDFEISGKKIFENQELTEGRFTFELSSKDGLFEKVTAKNDKNGNFTFAKINVTEANIGTHEVIVKELSGEALFIDYDKHEVTLSIVITDNHDGTLTCEILNDKGLAYSTDDTTFTNVYHAKGTFAPKALKEFPFALAGGEFTFELSGDLGSFTASNDADGKVSFPEISFDESSIGKTYNFTMKEVAGKVSFVVYDSTEYNFTLTVIDKHNGLLDFETNYNGAVVYEPFEFINSVKTAALELEKLNVETKEPVAGATYEVRDQFGNVLDTIVTGADGKATAKTLALGIYADKKFQETELYVVETIAPKGYALDPNTYKLDLSKVETHSVIPLTVFEKPQKQIFGYIKKGQMAVGTEKKETEFGTVSSIVVDYRDLAGVEFTIYKDADCKEAVAKVVTGEGNYDTETGVTYCEPLDLGTYYTRETAAPAGYVLDPTVYKVVLEGDESGEELAKILSLTNTYYNKLSGAELTIKKEGVVYDPETKTYSENTLPLEGVVFGVYTRTPMVCQGEMIAEADTLIGLIMTNEEGIGSIRYQLPNGTYYFKELRTLREFEIDDTAYDFEVDLSSEEVTKVDLMAQREDQSFFNYQIDGYIYGEKRATTAQGPHLAGCGFQFMNETTGEIIKNPDSEDGYWYTDETGLTKGIKVPIGTFNFNTMQWIYYTYSVEEKVAPPNYNIKSGKTTWSFFEIAKEVRLVTYADKMETFPLVIDTIELGLNDYLPAVGWTMVVISLLALWKKKRGPRRPLSFLHAKKVKAMETGNPSFLEQRKNSRGWWNK